MIDWAWVGTNTLWILGLALLLAAGSYLSYQGSRGRASARPETYLFDIGFATRLGLLLICLGLSATSGNWLERLLWGLISLVVLVETIVSRHRARLADGGDSGSSDYP